MRILKLNADTDPAHKESTNCAKPILEFARGREYRWIVLVGAISATPRWRYTRPLESHTCAEGDPRAVKAKKSYFCTPGGCSWDGRIRGIFYQPMLHIESALLGGNSDVDIYTAFLRGSSWR